MFYEYPAIRAKRGAFQGLRPLLHRLHGKRTSPRVFSALSRLDTIFSRFSMIFFKFGQNTKWPRPFGGDYFILVRHPAVRPSVRPGAYLPAFRCIQVAAAYHSRYYKLRLGTR